MTSGGLTPQFIGWVAGLLEGEGHFSCKTMHGRSWPGTIRVTLAMTDKDVVERFGAAFGRPAAFVRIRNNRPHHRPIYTVNISGARAAGLMMTIYPLMSARRKNKLSEVLAGWREIGEIDTRNHHNRNKTHCQNGHRYPPPTKGKDRHCLICKRARRWVKLRSVREAESLF